MPALLSPIEMIPSPAIVGLQAASLFDGDPVEDDAQCACDHSVARLRTRLRIAFDESGLTQKKIAQKLEVKPSVVSRWLSGRCNIGVRPLARLAFVMGYDLDIDLVCLEHGHRVSEPRSRPRFTDIFLTVNLPKAEPPLLSLKNNHTLILSLPPQTAEVKDVVKYVAEVGI